MPVPSALSVPVELHRDRLLTVADLLGVHPAGAVMCRLLGARPATLRAVVRGEDAPGLPADHLGLLALLAGVVRARLSVDGRPDGVALVRWRAWLRTPSLAGPGGPVAPLDALRDPAGVAAALADLTGSVDQRRGRVSVRLLSVVRPSASRAARQSPSEAAGRAGGS